MMTQQEFDRWCDGLNLRDSARKLISQIRESQPVRAVQGNRGNIRGNYCSNKMGCTIQFESHRGELAYIVDCLEHDRDVIEYYDQPSTIELNYLSKSGRKTRSPHTPDFFTITSNWVGWDEFKPQEVLIRESEEKPNRYVKDKEGNWRCPPGEEYAQKYGLGYRLVTSAQLDSIRSRNWNWLGNYFSKPFPSFDKPIYQEIVSTIQAHPGITYAEILQTAQEINADLVNYLIAAEKIFINFNTAPLSEQDRVRLFPNQGLATAYEKKALNLDLRTNIAHGIHSLSIEVGTTLSWDGQLWKIANTSPENIHLQNAEGKIINLPNEEFYDLFDRGTILGLEDRIKSPSASEANAILCRARDKDSQIAVDRYDAIKPYLGEDSPPITKVNRSIRRWRDSYLEAEKLYGNGYLGLLPKHLNKGYLPKLDPQLVEFMEEFIRAHYYNPKNRRSAAVHREFKVACRSHEPPFEPPSEKTFRLHVEKCASYGSISDREGSRAAKKLKPFYGSDEMPRNGERPWENVHIDHTPLDLELVSSIISLDTCNSSSAIDGTIRLGRCWATFMIDGYSRRILAMYLSFEEPSYRSCMMVMRVCVQKFYRLPETIITDNGSEFESIYFKQLVAYCGCDHKYRPPGEPRYGAPVERVFGTTNTQLIHELQGNTRILQKSSRQITKRVHPKNHAVWTVNELYNSLASWGYEIYDKRPHPSLTHSPKDAFDLGTTLGGRREMRRINYDDNFRILTLPSPDKSGTRRVQRGSGVKINLIYYWCDAFRDSEIEGTNVNIKIDPFNAGIAYAYVKNCWQECISNFHVFLKGKTEKELKVLSEDLRQRKRGHGKRTEISEAELVKHLQSAEVMEGELLKQRLKAQENQQVLDLIFDTSSNDRYSPPLVQAKSETLAIEMKKPEVVNSPNIDTDDEDSDEENNLMYYGKF